MNLLTILALAAQITDAANTCHALKNGAREVNPMVPFKSCTGQVITKSVIMIPVFTLKGKKQKIYTSAMLISGGIGISFSLVKR